MKSVDTSRGGGKTSFNSTTQTNTMADVGVGGSLCRLVTQVGSGYHPEDTSMNTEAILLDVCFPWFFTTDKVLRRHPLKLPPNLTNSTIINKIHCKFAD